MNLSHVDINETLKYLRRLQKTTAQELAEQQNCRPVTKILIDKQESWSTATHESLI